MVRVHGNPPYMLVVLTNVPDFQFPITKVLPFYTRSEYEGRIFEIAKQHEGYTKSITQTGHSYTNSETGHKTQVIEIVNC